MTELTRAEASRRFERRAVVRHCPRLLRGVLSLPQYLRYRLPPLGSSEPRAVRLPTFWGGTFDGMLPERVTSVVARFSFADEQVSRAMLRFVRPGDVVLDIGAHFGFFTLLGSWLVGERGRVVGIEAIPSTFAQLQRNVRANAVAGNAVAIHSAGGEAAGDLTFFDYGLEYSSLNSAFGARGEVGQRLVQEPARVDVPMQAVDVIVAELGLDRVDYVKLDTESSEHLVLAGMVDVLTRFRPLVSIELSDAGESERVHSERILAIMERHDYVPYRVSRHGLSELDVSTSFGYANPVFAPRGDTRLAGLTP